MKLKVHPVKGYSGIIECVDKHKLYHHFIGGNYALEDREDNWEFVKQMCEAHNEPFERIE